jgi:hypothetical protein
VLSETKPCDICKLPFKMTDDNVERSQRCENCQRLCCYNCLPRLCCSPVPGVSGEDERGNDACRTAGYRRRSAG